MFETKGERPQWAPLYDLLAGARVNQSFTYAQLNAVVDFDVEANRAPLYEAIRHLELESQRTAVNVRGIGYRIAEAAEHVGLGLKHQKKAKRQITKGRRKVLAADREQLTPEQRARNDQLAERLHRHESMLVNHERRLTALEGASKTSLRQQAKHDRELTELRSRLEALGIEVPAQDKD